MSKMLILDWKNLYQRHIKL